MPDFSSPIFFPSDAAVQVRRSQQCLVLLERVGPATEKHLPSALQMKTIKSSLQQLPLPAACFDSECTMESGQNSLCPGRSGPRGQGADKETR